MDAQQIRSLVENDLLKIKGVSGVGAPTKGAIHVYVQSLNPIEDEIPSTINGVPVIAIKVGKLYASNGLSLYKEKDPYKGVYEGEASPFTPFAATEPGRVQRVRPAPGGISIGHPLITAGTHGCSLRSLGIDAGISNNHVLAAESSVQHQKAHIGDPIYQPGPYDGGTINDRIGTLSFYRPINEVGPNNVDMALWTPDNDSDLANEILDESPIQGIRKVAVGDQVQKSGRTTGRTTGTVIDNDATLIVNYTSFEAPFQHQTITGYMSDPGDSGSALLGLDNKLGGILFAGSADVTVYNNIDYIMAALGQQAPIGGNSVVNTPLLITGLLTAAGIGYLLLA